MARITAKKLRNVSSTEFAGRFGQWSFAAQSEPVMVTNQKTGVVLGYFVSAGEFASYLKVRDRLPEVRRYAWEMAPDLGASLNKKLPKRRPKLDKRMAD